MSGRRSIDRGYYPEPHRSEYRFTLPIYVRASIACIIPAADPGHEKRRKRKAA